MEWYTAFLLLASGLVLAMASNIPVAFAFGIINIVAAYLLFGSVEALSFVVHASFSSVASIHLTAIPFFLLMGTIFVRTGLSTVVLDAVDRILSGVRASGCYVAVGSGALYGALMGASIASTAVMGATMVGDLRQRGYSNTLAIGPIIGSGTLANLIPPSLGAVLIGSLAGIPIADLLIAGVGPAMVVILLFCGYIAIKARRFTGTLAEVPATLRVRLGGVLLLVPMIVPVFFVTGVIYLGVATPTEASATGAFATFVVAAAYGRMNWKVFNESLMDALEIAAMIMLIVASSKAYSQILAITGIAPGFAEFLADVTSSPTVAVLIVLAIALVLGCFMDQTSVIFVTIPLVINAIQTLGVEPVWFGVLFSMTIGIGGITPPFGLNLFALKAVAPSDISMGEIYRICGPYVILELVAVGIVLVFPGIVSVLVTAMR
ncbi:MAG: TRAP transporter large permease subunit [Alphaproteobacteria bacterium]